MCFYNSIRHTWYVYHDFHLHDESEPVASSKNPNLWSVVYSNVIHSIREVGKRVEGEDRDRCTWCSCVVLFRDIQVDCTQT